MSNKFSKMLKSQKVDFDKLTQALTESTAKKSYDDERVWKLKRDDSDNGFAIIRFLPPIDGEDVPFITMWDHWFKGPGGIYAEKSLTTIGQDDPVSELNSLLWNNGTEEGKKTASVQKRRLAYFANILVIKDPAVPDNEGKVFLYKFGKKIFDKINDLMNPDPDEDPINPFDFLSGANFKVKVQKSDGWINYDKSTFANSSALFDGDETKLEEIWEKEYSLQALIASNQFKTYEELSNKLATVLKGKSGSFTKPKTPADSKPKKSAPVINEDKAETVKWDDDDDDAAFFDNLANS